MYELRVGAADVLIVTLLGLQLATRYRNMRRRKDVLPRLAARPHLRVRFYLRLIIGQGIAAAFVPAIVLVSPDLSAGDVGWAWPSGDGLDYLVALYLLALTVLSGLRIRYRMRRGHAPKLRTAMAALVPQTPRERWLAAALSVSAGVSEEAVFRGLLIGVGTRLYHLPTAPVALAALALFVTGHAYQRRRGMVASAVLGGAYTLVYVMSGSVLLTIILHVCQDLMALLVIPAHPTVPATPPGEDASPVTVPPAHTYPPQPAPQPVLRPMAPERQ